MKSKKLRLLALPVIASMAGAAGIVTGTLAYFTSTDKASVSIEAGQVKVSMALPADDLHTYSLDVEQDAGKFENGGKATLANNVLTLDRITPGDKVAFKVKVTNESNVDIKYKFTVNYSDEIAGIDRVDDQQNPIYVPTASDIAENPNVGRGYLSDGLVVTSTLAGGYNYLLNGAQPADSVITLELPKDAGNEYQAAVAKVTIGVIAYQKNAEVYSEKFVADANAVLAASSAVNPTFHGAITELAAADIDVVGFGTHHVYEDGDFLVWNQDTDQLKLANVFTAPNYKDWRIVDTLDEIPGLKYSAYLAGDDATGELVTNYGFDAGANVGLSKVEYRGLDTARTVHIRTASGGTSVDIHGYVDPTDSTVGDIVNHYGDAGLLQIFKVAGASYHEYGTAKYLIVEEGHVVLEDTAVVDTVNVANAEAPVSIAKKTDAEVVSVITDPANPNIDIDESIPVEKQKEAVQVTSEAEFAAAMADASISYFEIGADFSASAILEITRDVVIDGKDHTITTTGTRGIWVDYDNFNVTVKNLKIAGANSKMERAFQINTGYTGNLILEHCDFRNATYYCVNICSGVTANVTIRDCFLQGWCAFQAWGHDNYVNIIDSDLYGLNDKPGSSWNTFSTLVFEGDSTGQTTEGIIGSTYYMKGGSITCEVTGTNHQYFIGFNKNSINNTLICEAVELLVEGDGTNVFFYYNNGEGNHFSWDGTELIG